jgi:glycosyltransferase involved in cell wall biosynthesis
MKQPYLSVIIPAYNELDNFRRGALDKVWQYLKDRSFTWEVILVDDGSKDGSIELLKQFCQKKPGFRLIENPHLGKAGTVATGVKAARGKYVLFTDFDQATPLSEFAKLRPYLENGYEVAIGSREVSGAKREDEPFYRHLMGRGFNFGVRLLTVRGIADTQCGFKAFKNEVAQELFRKLQVYKPTREKVAFVGAFDVELLFIAQKLGYKIAEVPIHWQHVETARIDPVIDSMRMALDVIKIRLYHLLGRYD